MEGQGLSTRDLAGGSRTDEPPQDDLEGARPAPAADADPVAEPAARAAEPPPGDRGGVEERTSLDRDTLEGGETVDGGAGTARGGAVDDRTSAEGGAGATAAETTPASTGDMAAGDSPALLPEDENASFQRRWEELQTAFVDDPRRTVEQADELVALVMKRLAEGFAAEREHLEQQWGRGEDISTEDLRVALQRYRAFFQRLLSA